MILGIGVAAARCAVYIVFFQQRVDGVPLGSGKRAVPALVHELAQVGGVCAVIQRVVEDGEDDSLHRSTLPTYYIARYPVTHAQYAAFVRETGHNPPEADIDSERPYEWREGNCPAQRANQPVVLVTWHDALSYCRWLAEKLRAWERTPEPLATLLREEGWAITLPSEAEWEKAARGGMQIPSSKSQTPRSKSPNWVENPEPGRIFPWGSEPDPDRANYGDTGIGTTSAVGCFPGGASPYGVEDLSGNVWEWTRSLCADCPYDPEDGREDLEAGRRVRRVLRGGAFSNLERGVRCAYRGWRDPSNRYDLIGFRLVASPVHL